MAKKWIQKMHMKEGAFTAQAEKAEMGVQEYASSVLKRKSKASATTKRRANLAKTFAKISRKKK